MSRLAARAAVMTAMALHRVVSTTHRLADALDDGLVSRIERAAERQWAVAAGSFDS